MEDKIIEKLIKSAQSLLEFMQQINKTKDEQVKAFYITIADHVESEIRKTFEEYQESLYDSGITVEQYLLKLKPFIDVLRIYEDIKEGNSAELDEITEIINNPKRSNTTAIEYNPLFGSGVNNEVMSGKEPVVSFSNREGVDRTMVIKKGGLPAYEMSVLDKVVRQYRLGNVTSKNEVVFMLDDLCRSMIGKGNTRTPSAKQREDVKQALEKIRNTDYTLLTSDELADILGIEAAEIADRLEGYKHLKLAEPNAEKIHETHLIDKLDIVTTKYKRRGKNTTVVILSFGSLLQSLLDAFHWEQPLDEDINNVQYISDDGEIKDLTATKDNLAVLHYIHRKVFAKIRTNAAGSTYSNKINYETMFKYCEVDVTHNEQMKRRRELVERIFSDLQRKNYVVSFEEYTDKTGRVAGVQYITPKFELIDVEEC